MFAWLIRKWAVEQAMRLHQVGDRALIIETAAGLTEWVMSGKVKSFPPNNGPVQAQARNPFPPPRPVA